MTIDRIIEGSFSLNNVEQVYPNITEVEQTYVTRLEHGNSVDDTQVDFPDSYIVTTMVYLLIVKCLTL